MAKRHYDEPAPGNIFMGANNADNTNYNGVIGYTQTLGEQRSGHPQRQHRRPPRDHRHRQLPARGVRQHRLLGNHQRHPRGKHLQPDRQLLVDREQTQLQGGHRRAHRERRRLHPQTQPQGRFTFDRNYASNRGASGTGYSFATMRLGYPNLVQRDIVDTWPLIRRNFVGVFAQDDFRVNRKLSLQLGLRWDLMTPPVQVDNRQSNFSPVDGLIHLASADNRGPDPKTQYGYVAPRLGLAYSPDNGKTASVPRSA